MLDSVLGVGSALSEKKTSDIRIVRLAITMFKGPLKYYFDDPRNCELALRYCGASADVKDYFRATSRIDYDSAISHFQLLYEGNPSLFVNTFEYMLNDFVKESSSITGLPKICLGRLIETLF